MNDEIVEIFFRKNIISQYRIIIHFTLINFHIFINELFLSPEKGLCKPGKKNGVASTCLQKFTLIMRSLRLSCVV